MPYPRTIKDTEPAAVVERHRKLSFDYNLFERKPAFPSHKFKFSGSVEVTSDLTVKFIRDLIRERIDVCPGSVKVCVYQVRCKCLNSASSCDVQGFQPNEAYNMNTRILTDEDLGNTTELPPSYKSSDVRENSTLIVTFCMVALIELS